MAMTDAGRLQEQSVDGAGCECVRAEMVRAAVAEFIGMERSLRAAARHLAAAVEEIERGDPAELPAGADVPGLAAMAARVTLAG